MPENRHFSLLIPLNYPKALQRFPHLYIKSASLHDIWLHLPMAIQKLTRIVHKDSYNMARRKQCSKGITQNVYVLYGDQ